ncbi:MAG TPA: hypothetical protein VGI67_08830 [Thermoleophilaceae bacterium]|jgi:hypothetical protein
MEREESDQLPEEGPAEQVPDDDDEGREDAERNEPPGEGERSTGHPDEGEDD